MRYKSGHILACFLVCSIVGGSRISLDVSPQHLTKLTDELRIRCALQDTPELGALVGRDVSDTTVVEDLVGRDVIDNHQTSSLINVQTISSILVTLNGSDVASLMQSSCPQKLINSQNLQVTGSLHSSGDQKAFLELAWDSPSTSETGTFACEINGIDDVGHNIKLSHPVSVEYVSPTVDDLVVYTQNLKNKLDGQNSYISDLETKLNNQNTAISAMRARIDVLELNQNQSAHIEHGFISCGSSDTWTERWYSYDRIHRRQNFKSPYSKAPIVMLSVVEVHDNAAYSVWAVDLDQVNQAGFTVICRTWENYIFKELNIVWMSIPDMN